ncbi:MULTISPECIES: GatB/YqeY domain-containing protein [Prosthecochloris]|uniref:GatB/YqeY domain-containing protein n=1 Tax=Prosthecochloris vibrioformis TaxID=1098 RepID=A0A5C4RZ74_PROVB|nr:MULTISPECIES: GatB/YqeY domain-containing protein [Prosthecochloris]ANT65342.1 glutamyl-tRNA(Gln) amidotransferase subunit E [Prosthecochloris sp. CIB 2401]TNJ36218.1 GatB/YqeY domain-containing protein [Prosthecochloris vibrioformis]
MSLKARITEDLKTAMKDGDKNRLNAIRSIRAALLEKEVSIRVGGKAELTAEQELEVVMSLAKKRKDSIAQYREAGRPELAETEATELAVLETYLPAQMSDQETKAAVDAIIARTGAASMKEMGKVMGAAMKELKGKADGQKVQEFVKAALNA